MLKSIDIKGKDVAIFFVKLLITISLGFFVAVFSQYFFSKAGIYNLYYYLFDKSVSGAELIDYYKASISFWSAGSLVIERVIILSVVFSAILSHLVFGVKRTFSFIFKYRWIVGLIVIILLVAGKYNGNSLDSYWSVQGELGGQYQDTVIGFETPERSDEVLVDTASKLYFYNKGLPGMKMTAANIIQNPNILIDYLLLKTVGRDYAYSFDWYFYIILSFLVSIEFFMIITEKKRLLSLASTFMIFFSTFYLWWGFPGLLLNSMGIIWAFYSCLNVNKKSLRGLYGLLTAWFSIKFVFSLYPAWQVPIAYALLVLMTWVIVDQFAHMKKYNRYDWLIICSAVAIMLVGMYICYIDRLEYISSVSETVYPGERREYGSFSLQKLFNFIPCALFWLKRPEHMSENGAIIGLFPIPLFLSIYYVIKSKKKDILLVGLSLVSLLLLLYCNNGGLSKTIADITLLSYSTSWRAVDMIGFIEVILFARVIALYKSYKQDEYEIKNKWIRRVVVAGTALALSLYMIHMADYSMAEYMPDVYVYICFLIFAIICYLILSEYSYAKYKLLMCILIVFAIFTGFIIRPIRKGLDIIYDKPVAEAIEELRNEDSEGIWITYGSLVSQSYVKCFGVDVINYVNTTPNMELWTSLDPSGQYNEVYNRYAHVVVDFSEEDTSFELIQADAMYLHLAYKDLEKTNAKYMFSQIQLDVSNEYFTLDEVYNEGGVFIYYIDYAN